MSRNYALARLFAHLEDRGTPLTRSSLVAVTSERTVQRAIAQGHIARVSRGLYALPTARRTVEGALAVAAAWMPQDAVVVGAAAAWLWGSRDRDMTHVDVLIPRPRRLVPPPGIRLWRRDMEIPTMRIRGLRTSNAEHIPLQRWILDPRERTPGRVLDDLRELQLPALLVEDAMSAYQRLPDRQRLSKILAVARQGVTSALEFLARTEVFVGAEWDEWEWQGRVRLRGRTAIIDMLHRRSRVAVELDGARYHSNDTARRRDIERDARLSASGYVTLRFTYEDITRRPQWCREQVRRTLNARLGA